MRLLIPAVLVSIASVAHAQQQAAPSRPEALDGLRGCRAITNAEERLACFDRVAASIDEAIERRELVVVDREEVRRTRRSLFGFPLPRIGLFGGRGEEAEAEVELDREVNATIQSVSSIGGGRWEVRLDSGAVWQTMEAASYAPQPRSGEPVRIRRASMGSYFMNIDGRRAIRARRVG